MCDAGVRMEGEFGKRWSRRVRSSTSRLTRHGTKPGANRFRTESKEGDRRLDV